VLLKCFAVEEIISHLLFFSLCIFSPCARFSCAPEQFLVNLSLFIVIFHSLFFGEAGAIKRKRGLCNSQDHLLYETQSEMKGSLVVKNKKKPASSMTPIRLREMKSFHNHRHPCELRVGAPKLQV
jgi:hypothetical protein